MIDAAETMTLALQKLLQSTVELSQELLLETNLEGAILEISPAWTHVLGWTASSFESRHSGTLYIPAISSAHAQK